MEWQPARGKIKNIVSDLYSKNPKRHYAVILFLFCFLCGKLEPSNEIHLAAFLYFAIFTDWKRETKFNRKNAI